MTEIVDLEGQPLLDVVHHCDALTLLRALPENSVDAVITDPPYGTKVATWDKEVPPQEILTECLRVSKGAVVWFGAAVPRQVKYVMAYEPFPDRILIWHVTFSLAQTAAHGIYYRYHPIYCWRLPNNNIAISQDVIQMSQDGHNGWYHPGTKPLRLMEKLVSAFGGDTILDPFLGSGTTAVAARNLGRHYIGCDISAEYVEIAHKRLAMPFTPPLF